MERRFLEECLAKGMSLEAIGREVGKHPSTVGYWLNKHGLGACNAKTSAPKGALDEDRLRELTEAGMTLRQIAEAVDRSVSTVRHWLGRYELKTAGRRRPRPAGDPKRAEMECRRHGRTTFVLEGRGYYRCARCRSEAVSKRRRNIKKVLVAEAGGRCAICAYDRCQEALHFHHLDPSLKEFHLAFQGQSRSLERARREAGKCILLCGNCHAEVECGRIRLPRQLATE
jgi:transposase